MSESVSIHSFAPHLRGLSGLYIMDDGPFMSTLEP
jgi:hypothetical protein